MKVLETILGTKCSLGSFDRHCVLFVEETGCERIQMCVGIVGGWCVVGKKNGGGRGGGGRGEKEN